VHSREWISVAAAAGMMGVCKRQALRLLVRRDAELDGRLLRRVGQKRMPGGVQASKYLVSVTVLRESLRPDDAARDLESIRLEVVVLRQQLTALWRAFRRREQRQSPANAT
jgi:hypothetical protein